MIQPAEEMDDEDLSPELKAELIATVEESERDEGVPGKVVFAEARRITARK